MARSTKSENKTVVEKASKVLSSKKQSELDHLQGKHKATGIDDILTQAISKPDCGFCQRRPKRYDKKRNNTQRFYTGQKK